jgi:hypothetical protein
MARMAIESTDRTLGIVNSLGDIEPLETFIKPLWWQELGLTFTASGYGQKIPTQYMVKHDKRLKRVYTAVFSNSGMAYIIYKGQRLLVEDCHNEK